MVFPSGFLLDYKSSNAKLNNSVRFKTNTNF